jgi:hypothetical protein
MTNGEPPPLPPPPETAKIAPDDLARMIAASAVPTPMPEPSRRDLRKKLLLGIAIGAIGVGASFMSCVGQSFSYRQARALEGIEQQLKELRVNCTGR